jgi:hypothetical protein
VSNNASMLYYHVRLRRSMIDVHNILLMRRKFGTGGGSIGTTFQARFVLSAPAIGTTHLIRFSFWVSFALVG